MHQVERGVKRLLEEVAGAKSVAPLQRSSGSMQRKEKLEERCRRWRRSRLANALCASRLPGVSRHSRRQASKYEPVVR
jgi:hypothetical protein